VGLWVHGSMGLWVCGSVGLYDYVCECGCVHISAAGVAQVIMQHVCTHLCMYVSHGRIFACMYHTVQMLTLVDTY